ncbi:MAG: pyruvate kinase [Clostridia bacterium]|nr:pyruvate kinase [Clostridia bacterium]
MRKTKIVCTIGPACSDEITLKKMCLAGMNVARLNFSHGTHEDHQKNVDMLKRIRQELNIPLAIMLDTKGPEYRVGTFKNGKEELSDGDTFTFTTRDVEGDKSIVSVSYKNLSSEICPGDKILVNNGLLLFNVLETTETDVICRVVEGGVISNRKSMSFPNKVMNQVYLSEQDKKDILFGIQNDVEYIACSFVSRAQDVIDVKSFIKENNNGECNIGLISKIENRAGIENIEAICEECDGIMIGRGDLGVEIPFEEVPATQKKLITKCRLLGKRVITATEMLESMINNPRPTRAEISDVANAVFDGTSAIMLSGETAAGKHPVLTVQTMSRIAEQAEKSVDYKKYFYSSEFRIQDSMDAISHSVCALSIDIEAKAIVVSSMSGSMVRMISRFRSPVDIIGLSVNEKTFHQLALSWGVMPVMCEVYPSLEVLFYTAKNMAKEKLNLKKNDKIIITGGSRTGESGKTNTVRVDDI